MIRFLPVLIIAGLALYSFFDVLGTPKHRFAGFSKVAWLLVTLIPVVGATLWFLLGRPGRDSGGSVIKVGPRPAGGPPLAPDDDPDFLRHLDEQAWRARRENQRRQGQTPAAPPAPSGTPESTSDHSDEPTNADAEADRTDPATADEARSPEVGHTEDVRKDEGAEDDATGERRPEQQSDDEADVTNPGPGLDDDSRH